MARRKRSVTITAALIAAPVAVLGVVAGAMVDDWRLPWESVPSDTAVDPVPVCGYPVPDALLAEARDVDGVVVESRCASNPDAPVGAYDEPTQGAAVVERLMNDAILPDACLTAGQELSNADGLTSDQWVRYTLLSGDFGFVPAIWTVGDEERPECG